MHNNLLISASIGVVWMLAYFGVSYLVWVSVIIALLFLLIFSGVSSWFLFPAFLLFLSIAVFLGVKSLRIRFLSEPAFAFLCKTLPSMGATEREALEAGDVWWEQELFCGKPNWKKLLAMPKPALSAEEQAFIDNQVEVFCSLLNDWKIVHDDHDLSEKAWNYLKKEGFLGISIPKEYGGFGFSTLAHSSIIVKIATCSVSAAVNAMVPNSLGPGELLYHYGTLEQKKYYLPRLARGEEIPCFALTGPEAGSDATAMLDTGIVCRGQYEGKDTLGIRLNFDKRYITLAPIATVLGLAFKLYDPDGLIGTEKDIGITVCLIPLAYPGIERGSRHFPMGMAFLNGPVRGKDVFIPLEWIIGGEEQAGQGWRMLMECLSVGRSISLPALSTAAGQFCYRVSGAYARLRKQFKISIGKFEGVEEALARIGGHAYLLEATRIMTANAVDQGVKPAVVSAIAKYHMTETLRKIVNDTMDIHAGRGIQLGPRNYLAQLYFSAPIGITVEGANILTRNLIIFGQGAIRCHPFIRHEMEAGADSNKERGLNTFDGLLFSHMGYTFSHFIRLLTMSFSGGRLLSSPGDAKTRRYYRQLTRMSTALAFVSDITMMLLGGKLKRKERLSARLGDVLSYLYLASAVLKYYENEKRPTSDLPYVHWTIQLLLYKMQKTFNEFFENFPQRTVGILLRFLIFPFGCTYRMPSDKWDHNIAAGMQESSTLRDRLTRLCYLSKNENDPVNGLEHALNLLWQAEPIQKKLQENHYEGRIEEAREAGIITEQEAKLLEEAEKARLDAMQVDEFNADYFKNEGDIR